MGILVNANVEYIKLHILTIIAAVSKNYHLPLYRKSVIVISAEYQSLF